MDFVIMRRMMPVTISDVVMDDNGTTKVVTTIELPDRVMNEWVTQKDLE